MTEYVEQITWHEVTYRALTDEEKAEYAERGYSDYEIPESFFDCKMPDDEVLLGSDDCELYGYAEELWQEENVEG